VVVVVGVVITLAAPAPGWFAYAPLADYAFVAGTRPWQDVVGPALVLVGAVVAAFAAGRLSVRSPR
jgi:heme/copper-type cytochrome/quinol oxidase subunit 1